MNRLENLMALKLKNNAAGRLAVPIDPDATTIAVQAGEGVNFPAISPGDWFPLTLSRADGSHEILRVTARSGDTMTVVRGQEGTQAKSFNVNDRADVRLTAGTLEARFEALDPRFAQIEESFDTRLNALDPKFALIEQSFDDVDQEIAIDRSRLAVIEAWISIPGVVLEYDGLVPPAGWLFCAGQIVQISQYPKLYAVLGTRYGGNGTTTFGIPDRRGRVSAGADNMGGAAAGRLSTQIAGTTLGAVGGFETHVLTAAEMPVHAHGVNDAGHGHGVTDPTHAHGVYDPGHNHHVNDPGHSHSYERYTAQGAASHQSGTNQSRNNVANATSASGSGIWLNASGTNIGIYGAGTGISINGSGTGISIQNNGSGQAHNNLQPTFITNKIIRT